jgi:putative DNA primase/helicase
MLGNGSNGKSKVIELMKNLLGVQNCSSVSLHTLGNSNFAKAQLHTKLVNLSADISSDAINNTGVFKELFGDTLFADRKHREPIEFQNYANEISLRF